MNTVHIVGDFSSYCLMFAEQGWGIVDCIEDANLVQVCGGEDVWPGFYKETPRKETDFNLQRDRYERAMWELARAAGCKIAGICRGAQFVHVMNGGALYQDVNNHALKQGHLCTLIEGFSDLSPSPLVCSSTHHQMMREGPGVVVLTAAVSTQKYGQGGGSFKAKKHYVCDVEAVYYEETGSFSFQPHPEYYVRSHPCRILYFQLLKRLLFTKKGKK